MSHFENGLPSMTCVFEANNTRCQCLIYKRHGALNISSTIDIHLLPFRYQLNSTAFEDAFLGDVYGTSAHTSRGFKPEYQQHITVLAIYKGSDMAAVPRLAMPIYLN